MDVLTAAMCRVCVETDRDTRLIVIMPYGTTAAECKERVCQAHRMSFPEHGDVAIKRIMIMVAGFWYVFSQGCVGTACQGTDARFKVDFFEEQEEVLDGSPQRTSESDREAVARSSGDSRPRRLRLIQQPQALRRSSQDAHATLRRQRSLVIEERDVSGPRAQSAARETGISSPANESATNTEDLQKNDEAGLVSKMVDMAEKEKSASPLQAPVEKPGEKELENPPKDGNPKVVMEEPQKQLEEVETATPEPQKQLETGKDVSEEVETTPGPQKQLKTGKDKVQVTISEEVETAAKKTPPEPQKQLETGKDKIQVNVSEEEQNAAKKTTELQKQLETGQASVREEVGASAKKTPEPQKQLQTGEEVDTAAKKTLDRNVNAEASMTGSSKVNAQARDKSGSGKENVEESRMEEVRGGNRVSGTGIGDSKAAEIKTMVGVQGTKEQLKESKADSSEQNQNEAEMETDGDTGSDEEEEEEEEEEKEMLNVKEAKSLSVPAVAKEEGNKTDGKDNRGATENVRSEDKHEITAKPTTMGTSDGVGADRDVTDEEENVKEKNDKDSGPALSVDAENLEAICDKVITQHFSSDTSSSDDGEDKAAEKNVFQPVKLSKVVSEGKRTKMLAHKRVMADSSSESESDDSFLPTSRKRLAKRLKSVSSSSESESEKAKDPEANGKDKQVAASSPHRKLKDQLAEEEDPKAPEEKRMSSIINAVQGSEKPQSKEKATIPDDGDSSEDSDGSSDSERKQLPQSKATEKPKDLGDAGRSQNEKLKSRVIETDKSKQSGDEAFGKGKKQSELVLKDDENSEESEQSREQALKSSNELGAKVSDRGKQQANENLKSGGASQKVDKSSQEKDKKKPDAAGVSQPPSQMYYSQPTIQTQADSESSSGSDSDSDESNSDVSGVRKQVASKVSAPRRNPRRNNVDSRFQEFVEKNDGLEKLLSIRRLKPPEVVPETQNVVEEEAAEDPMPLRTCEGASTSAPSTNRKRPPVAKNPAAKKRATKQDASVNRAEPSPSSSKPTPSSSKPAPTSSKPTPISSKPTPTSTKPSSNPVLASPSPSAINSRGLASLTSSVMSGKVTGKKVKGKKSANKGR